MPTYQMKYGTLTTGRVERLGSGYLRRDTWTPYATDHTPHTQPMIERYHAAGPDDDTPPHNSLGAAYGGSYDPHCPSCWLNNPHTERKHAEAIESYWNSAPYARVANLRTVDEIDHDCDGATLRQIEYADVTCPHCRRTETRRAYYLGEGDGLDCACSQSYRIPARRTWAQQ